MGSFAVFHLAGLYPFHAIFIKVRYVLHVIFKNWYMLTDCRCVRGDSMFVEYDSRWEALEIELLPRVGHVRARRDN